MSDAMQERIAEILWTDEWDNPNDPPEQRMSWGQAKDCVFVDADVFRCRHLARRIDAMYADAEAARIREDLETWPGPGRRDDLNSGAVYGQEEGRC